MMRLLEASRKKSFLIEEAVIKQRYTVIKQRLSLGIKTEICNTANPGLLGCAENLLAWKAKLSWSILRECIGRKKELFL